MSLEGMINFYEGLPVWLIAIITIWSLAWKGLAMWKAGRKNSPIWFVILLVVNTLGILEILYLFLFSELPYSKGKERKEISKNIKKRKIGKKY